MDIVYVIPGIGIFSNTGVWCGPAWDIFLHDFNLNQIPDKKTRSQEMKAVTSDFAVGHSGFPDSYPTPLPSTFSLLFMEKEPRGWYCSHPSQSQKLLFWAIIHRLFSAAAACEHLPECKIPGARSWKERATTCMFCCVWLISSKSSNASYVPGELSNIQQLALSGYAPHRRWNEGNSDLRVQTNKTIDWTGGDLWDHPGSNAFCNKWENWGSRKGHGLPYIIEWVRSTDKTSRSQLPAQCSFHYTHQATTLLEEACWKLLLKEIVGGSKAGKLNIWP